MRWGQKYLLPSGTNVGILYWLYVTQKGNEEVSNSHIIVTNIFFHFMCLCSWHSLHFRQSYLLGLPCPSNNIPQQESRYIQTMTDLAFYIFVLRHTTSQILYLSFQTCFCLSAHVVVGFTIFLVYRLPYICW